ncbi:L-threonylcarbamoyladenylate synthase [Neisseriaceae bacterium B1]
MIQLPTSSRLRAHLKRGGIIAYPTEYCYGLGCDPRNTRALKHIMQLKKRPQHKGLIVIGQNLAQLTPLLNRLPENLHTHLQQTWPAAKTFVLPTRQTVLTQLRGQRRTQLAVRVPAHELARQLCALAKMPLVSTSCNRARAKPCKTERQARRLFGREVWVIGGRVGGRKRPSEIIDWQSGQVLR